MTRGDERCSSAYKYKLKLRTRTNREEETSAALRIRSRALPGTQDCLAASDDAKHCQHGSRALECSPKNFFREKGWVLRGKSHPALQLTPSAVC